MPSLAKSWTGEKTSYLQSNPKTIIVTKYFFFINIVDVFLSMLLESFFTPEKFANYPNKKCQSLNGFESTIKTVHQSMRFSLIGITNETFKEEKILVT